MQIDTKDLKGMPFSDVPIGTLFEYGGVWYRMVKLPPEPGLPAFRIGYAVADQRKPLAGGWTKDSGVALTRSQIVSVKEE